MELPHCPAMWWQHSRSAGVIVAPGRTHAMAGVMAHRRAIVSRAYARVLVTLISVLRFLTAMDEFSLQTKPWYVERDDNCCDGNHSPRKGVARNRQSCRQSLIESVVIRRSAIFGAAVQFEREEAGPDPFATRSFGKEGTPETVVPKIFWNVQVTFANRPS